MRLKNCIAGLLMILGGSVMAQPDDEFTGMKLKYPGETLVTLRNEEIINIDVVSGKLQIKGDNYLERMYLNSRAGLYSEFSVEYSDLKKITHIEAATFVPGKRDYKKLEVKDFKDQQLISQNVFYDGSRTISFFYPQVEPGVKTLVKYTEEYSQPQLMGTYFFQAYSPTIQSSFTVITAKDVELGWKLFNVADSACAFTKTVDRSGKIIYNWKMKDVPKYESDDQSPDIRYTMPHMNIWIKSYVSNGKQVRVLSDVQDLYNWVHSIGKDVNKDDIPALHAVVDSLVAGVKDEDQKVKNIFYWVQDHIRYIAFEDGMGGFIPRSAQQVLDKRFGDCKDMSSLMNTMLNYAGASSHLTWIGSRELPYSYNDMPTPTVDDHMIVTWIKGDKYTFLDATGENTPFGMPTWYIQGKDALIGINDTKYEVKKVPEVDASKNLIADSVFIRIDNTKINGTGRCEFKGYADQMISNVVIEEQDLNKYFRQILSKGSNKFLIDSLHVNDASDRDQPLLVDYTFNVEDYVRNAGDEIYINMNLDKYQANDDVEKDRKLPLVKKYRSVLVNTVYLQIPDGYKVEYMPSEAKGGNERFGYKVKYKQSGNIISLESSYTNHLLQMDPSDFESWNKMIRELKSVYSEVVILKKIKKA